MSSGVNSTETQITPASLTVANFGKVFTTNVTDVPNLTGIPTSVLPAGFDFVDPGGQVYAEPLVKTNVNITTGSNQGLHNVVFVATTMDSLYAIDANSGTILWKDSFLYNAGGNPNPLNPTIPAGVTAVPAGVGSEINCQDVSPWVGIIATPVIDGVNGYIYLVANTREADGNESQPHYIETLHKISLSNGLDTNTIIADTTYLSSTSFTYNSGPWVAGSGAGHITVNGQNVIYFNAVRQMIRPGLVLYGGRVYIASASHGDNGPYHGWILSYDAGSLTLNGVWNTSPGGASGEAGVWQGGGGVVIDPETGDIYFQTGNGDFDGTVHNTNGTITITGLTAQGFPNAGDYGDCFIRLTLDPTTSQGKQGTNLNGWGLKIVDYFSPYNNSALNAADDDLGSGGPTLLPDSAGSTANPVLPHLIIGGGKVGTLYLINRDNMGKFGATDSVVQTITGLDGILSIPSYFNGVLYATPGYGGVTVSWPLANAAVNTAAMQSAPESIAFPGCSTFITANGTTNGVLWEVDHGTGQLRAYNASNLTQGAIWTSNLNPSRDSLGSTVKFAAPTAANGMVYVGTSGYLIAYGPAVAATGPPAAPSGLTATASGPATISLTWTDNSNNESGFLIERSSDDVNFTQIGSVGVNVTTYGDSGLSSQATYYYRVRATNSYNTVSYSAYSNVATAMTAGVGSVLPVDLYSFDEGTGTTTVDSAGGNNGTLIGTPLPGWITPGRIGGANLSFSGTGAYNAVSQSAVQVTNDLSPILGTSSSLLFWIKTTQLGNNTHWMAPAVTGVEQTGAGNDIGWGYLDASGHICLAVGDSGSVKSTNPINDGNWHHVGLTRNATTGAVAVYVDGVLSGSGTLGTGNMTSQFKLIGVRSVVKLDGVTFTGANFLNAQLDDVRIYNVVVTQALVSSIALAPAPATGLTITPASGTELDLSWVDNATNATGYEVWSAIGTGAFARLAQLPATATSYPSQGLNQATLYYYFVRAIGAAGSADSAIVSATTPVPPATPTNATVVGLTPTEVDMTWLNNATNDLGYYVLRLNTGGAFTQIAQLAANSTSYSDTTVQAGLSYDYHIEAYNIAGISDFAGFTVTTPTTATLPSAATSPAAMAISGTAVNLSWVDNSLNENAYQVWQSVNGGAFVELVQLPPTSISYSVAGLTPGNTYSYYIVAVNATGTANSTTVTVTTPGAAPTTTWVSDMAYVAVANGWGPVEKDTSNGEQAAGDGHTISIRGTTFAKGLGCHAYSEIDVPLNGGYATFTSSIGIDDEVAGKGMVDFQVFGDATKLFDSGTVTGTSPLETTGILNVTGVTTLKLFVQIVGPNNGYDHSDWAGAKVSTAPAATLPAAPTGLMAMAASGTTVNLSWVDNATNATGYQVWSSVNGGAFTDIAQLSATATSYPETGLTAGYTYSYYVAAVNGAGSTDSSTVSVTTPVPVVTMPAAPTGLVATAASGTAVNLSWVDNATNATAYQVWSSVNGGAFADIAQLSATATSYPATGLTAGYTYSYYIAAVNSAGSTDSSTVSVTTPVVVTPTTAYISDLPYVAVTNGWGPVEKDMSNGQQAAGDGHTITIRGKTYAKGLGCHANSEVDVPLNGAYETFTTSIGIDDEVNGLGAVDFQIVADGVKIYDSGTITGTSSVQNTGPLNVTGVNTLKLLVNFVGANNGYDHADWAGAQVTTAPIPATSWLSDFGYIPVSSGYGPIEQDTSNGQQAGGDGHTISIRGTTFTKGLGCHANSEIDVPLNGAYSTFTSSVGIDDEVNGLGAVDFSILADGVKIYDSGTLTGTSPLTGTGVLNIKGVTLLKLLVNFVGANNAYDHSDWAGAQISK